MPWDRTAGGLWSAADLTDRLGGSTCVTLVKATPTGFVPIKWRPTEGFYNCDKANVVTLKVKLPAPLTLASVGKTIDDVK